MHTHTETHTSLVKKHYSKLEFLNPQCMELWEGNSVNLKRKGSPSVMNTVLVHTQLLCSNDVLLSLRIC